jgi:hypothetical protein
MSDTVRIVEVGPRGGLQNEKTPVGAGLHTEVGAFRIAEGDSATRRNGGSLIRPADFHRRPGPRAGTHSHRRTLFARCPLSCRIVRPWHLGPGSEAGATKLCWLRAKNEFPEPNRQIYPLGGWPAPGETAALGDRPPILAGLCPTPSTR